MCSVCMSALITCTADTQPWPMRDWACRLSYGGWAFCDGVGVGREHHFFSREIDDYSPRNVSHRVAYGPQGLAFIRSVMFSSAGECLEAKAAAPFLPFPILVTLPRFPSPPAHGRLSLLPSVWQCLIVCFLSLRSNMGEQRCLIPPGLF